jgi:hypothetical protein
LYSRKISLILSTVGVKDDEERFRTTSDEARCGGGARTRTSRPTKRQFESIGLSLFAMSVDCFQKKQEIDAVAMHVAKSCITRKVTVDTY